MQSAVLELSLLLNSSQRVVSSIRASAVAVQAERQP